ncbi:helix-turn-helix domain-containing protein [Streptomyces palmae]|uniref:Helix-turn-helix domain-containing protein n=1 Tax=Streptomyces palmae TaxID=1701085 RepID=A0A4Z0GHQ0_9ACTN|nr:helix-turn-helix domain-containing protein [Streptomyces palmae]TGA95470.1 helix-turn-helix domain-containing protein [Streptomyces palmae]
MYPTHIRERVLTLVGQGRSLNSISRETGISRSAIRDWTTRAEPVSRAAECQRCAAPPTLPDEPAAYVYLLGLYLGDGCISSGRRGVYALRIACAAAWPGLVDACARAVRSVRPQNSVCFARSQGCVMVTSSSKHWPCLFPQHGPGKKHERPIVLQPWQQELVDAHPWEFIRGLVHSDGCRITNWTTRVVGGERKRYEYPRYFFTNKSADIRQLYCAALDRVGVEWRITRRGTDPYNVSVARRGSVALMDIHVGPKH